MQWVSCNENIVISKYSGMLHVGKITAWKIILEDKYTVVQAWQTGVYSVA